MGGGTIQEKPYQRSHMTAIVFYHDSLRGIEHLTDFG